MSTFNRRSISIHDVQETVARSFHLSTAEPVSPSRGQRVTCVRHVAMYLSRWLAGARDAVSDGRSSFPRIGIAFARDPSSVIHACKVIERRRSRDAGFAGLLKRLAGELRGRIVTIAREREAA